LKPDPVLALLAAPAVTGVRTDSLHALRLSIKVGITKAKALK